MVNNISVQINPILIFMSLCMCSLVKRGGSGWKAWCLGLGAGTVSLGRETFQYCPEQTVHIRGMPSHSLYSHQPVCINPFYILPLFLFCKIY